MSNSIYKRHNKTQNVNNINEPKTTKGKEYDRTKTKKNNTSQKKHTKLQNLELYTTHYSELNTKQTILTKTNINDDYTTSIFKLLFNTDTSLNKDKDLYIFGKEMQIRLRKNKPYHTHTYSNIKHKVDDTTSKQVRLQ